MCVCVCVLVCERVRVANQDARQPEGPVDVALTAPERKKKVSAPSESFTY